jgi:DNA-binding MarR family transcriptional regulator
MELEQVATEIQKYYPQIYHACHTEHVKAASSEVNLSSRDSAILAHVSVNELSNPSRLARHLKVSASTISEALANLESLGYVKSQKDANDDRKQKLVLTDKGLHAMKSSSVLDSFKLIHLLSFLTAEDRLRAVEGLAILAKAATTAKN